jgi:hypothetical protein
LGDNRQLYAAVIVGWIFPTQDFNTSKGAVVVTKGTEHEIPRAGPSRDPEDLGKFKRRREEWPTTGH